MKKISLILLGLFLMGCASKRYVKNKVGDLWIHQLRQDFKIMAFEKRIKKLEKEVTNEKTRP